MPLTLAECAQSDQAHTAIANSVIEGETLDAAAKRISTDYPQIDETRYDDGAEGGGQTFEIWTLDEDLASNPDLNSEFGLPEEVLETANHAEGPTAP